MVPMPFPRIEKRKGSPSRFRFACLLLAFGLFSGLQAQAQTACTAITLSSTGAFAPVAGGNGTFNASGTPSNCNKSAASTVDWITISFGGGTANPSTIGYTVQPNPSATQRVGTINVNGGLGTFTVTQPGITCTFSFSPSSASLANTAVTGQTTVNTQSGCNWSASVSQPWISITAGVSGTGDGTLSYAVQPNPTNQSRSGTISIGSSNFTITQAAGCSFTLNPASQNIRSTAETGSITITASNSSCVRNAVSDASWLTIPVGSSGTGNGTLSWTAAANTTPTQRTGRITIGDATFVLVQEGSTCTYALNPTSLSAPATGASGSIGLTTACSWSATASASWLGVTTATAGTGNASIGYRVDPNPTTQTRSGTIQIGAVAFNVSQAGAACALSLTSSSQEFAAAGGDGSVGVDVQANCPWTATSSVPWVTLTSATAGDQDSTVSFRVAPNLTSLARIGVITIGTQRFTITQAGANCELALSATTAVLPNRASSGSFGVVSTCQWSAQSQAGWLTITQGLTGSGNGTVEFAATANPTAAARTGTIRVGTLSFTVNQSGGQCTLSLSPANLLLPANVFTGRVQVNGGIGCAWQPESAATWLQVASWSAINGSGSVELTALPNLTGADRTTTLQIGTESVAVQQAASRPTLAANGILNAASFRGGQLSPGEIITIYGTLLGPETLELPKVRPDNLGLTTELAGTRVLFDGEPGAMIYSSRGQVSAVVPYAVAGRPSTRISVELFGARSAELSVPVVNTNAALFTQDASGRGAAAILNQDNSLNTPQNAAQRNTIIQLFATGLGVTNPASGDGEFARLPLPALVARPTVRIGNLDAPVVYAGPAPGLVNGLVQINARIPANAPVGAAVPILLRLGTTDSPAGTTLAIR